MNALVLTAVIAASPQLLVLDLEPGSRTPEEAALLTERLTRAATETERYEVIAQSDLRSLVDLESERRKLDDCDDDSCLAEIAGALGAELLVTGRLGTLGSKVVLQVQLFDAKRATVLARVEESANDLGDLDVARASAKLFGSEREAPPAAPPLGLIGWTTAGVGAAALVGCGAWASVVELGLQGAPSSTSTEKFDDDRFMGGVALTCAGVGAATLVTGVVVGVIGGAE